MSVNVAAADARPAGEVWTLWLVSIGHGFSHFYMIALAPLFPLLHAEFDVSWTALGLILTLYGLVSGVIQIPLGFWVDKVGARAILLWGFGIQAVAFVAAGYADGYWPLLAAMVVAGIGNAVFHPADYAILSNRIPNTRIGRAFGTHLFASYIGWMVAPVAMLTLTQAFDWRTAMIVSGLAGVAYLGVMIWLREHLADVHEAVPHPGQGRQPPSGLALFAHPPVVLFFLFFLVLSVGGFGLQTFAVPSLMQLHGATLEEANTALTLFFLAGGIGILAGGQLADRVRRHDHITAVAFVIGAFLTAAIGFVGIGVYAAVALLFVGAVFNSLVSPSRDVMVRNISPPGAVGAVFGVVTTGFAVGGSIAPVLFGWINDIGHPEWVFWLSAITFLVAIVIVYAAQAARR